MDPIDDTVLADFLAGQLSPARRAEVIRQLAASAEARERLRLAYLALETTRETRPVAPLRPQRRDAAPRPARPHALPRYARIAAVGALLIGSAVVLRLSTLPEPDPVRNRAETTQDSDFTARISPSTLAISWQAVPGAHHYEVMIWDEAAARDVATERVESSRLPAESAFASTLRSRLTPGHPYAVQITAFDATNRRLAASDLVSFRYDG